MTVSVRDYRSLLRQYLSPQWLRVCLLAVLLLGSIALQLVNPQIMRSFLDTAQSGGAMALLVRLALLFLGIAVVQQAISVAATYVSENVGWTATNALRADLAAHCLHLDLTFQSAHTPGEMIERVDGDATALTDFFSQFIIQVVGNALLLAGILAMLFRIDWRVGAALTLFAAVALFLMARFHDLAVPHWKEQRRSSAELFGFLEERLAGTEDIRANGGEPYAMRRFVELMRDLLRRSLKAALMVNVLVNASFFLFDVGVAAAFALGAWLYQKDLLTLGTVYIVFYYTSLLDRPIRQITRQMETLQRAGAGLARIRELLRTPSQIVDAQEPVLLPAGPLALEFRDVSFRYHDDRPGTTVAGQPAEPSPDVRLEPVDAPEEVPEDAHEMVLHDLSFSLAPGRVLGLLGRTGSGKTTLTRLLLRLYEPDSGTVMLGAPGALADLRWISLQNLRQRAGMVTQNIQLFHATVRDNLTFFDKGVADERIVRTLQELGLESWLASLPSGLDTVLESGGAGLSAGQAQLLAFARIFLRDPGLVILDEASSRLDPATEALIEHAVKRLVQGRTAIIIAHRLHTVQRADEIMILEQGRTAELGERCALEADPESRFSRLLQAGLEEVLV